jgi:23S rRNA pseudouridine955/2504/2580 synthase
MEAYVMQTITIDYNESGQRLDKFLIKYLSRAHKNYIYKLLRTKYIKLNGKKAQGNESVKLNDNIIIYLSDEVISGLIEVKSAYTKLDTPLDTALDIIYEDTDIMLINKSAGVLSQRAGKSDISLVEMIAAHLQSTGELDGHSGRAFAPSVANRLDRNTSGLVAAGKTLYGLQTLSAMIAAHRIEKYYLCLVVGTFKQCGIVNARIEKDEWTNKSVIAQVSRCEPRIEDRSEFSKAIHANADGPATLEKTTAATADTASSTSDKYMSMQVEPIEHSGGDFTDKYAIAHSNGAPLGKYTLVSVKLLTGRSHQIRAYMSQAGYPIVGDPKYGDPQVNAFFKKNCGLNRQLLHAERMIFPDDSNIASGKTLAAPLPRDFARACEVVGIVPTIH